MKKRGKDNRALIVILIIIGVFFLFFVLPMMFLFAGAATPQIGNVALIKVDGPITANGAPTFGSQSASSQDLVKFIEQAADNDLVEVILVEINSPGGSAVASDEIATALKNSGKPTVALIREVGASGGYWIASAADHIVANRMSITGSIGVISSYLEFSGLFEEYGIGYERLVAGENKDMGIPFKELSPRERAIFQKKLDLIHDFFIEEVAQNRDMSESAVRKVATGEFYLGIEAQKLGLVDELGDKDTAEAHMKEEYGLDSVEYIVYQREPGFFDLLAGVFEDFSFHIGQGIGSVFAQDSGRIIV